MPGGIIVRTACETSSQQLPERLQTNTVVKELGDLCRRCIVKQGVWPLWTNWKRKHAAATSLYFNTCFSVYRFSCIFRLWLWEGFSSLADTTLLLYPCNVDMIDLHDKHHDIISHSLEISVGILQLYYLLHQEVQLVGERLNYELLGTGEGPSNGCLESNGNGPWRWRERREMQ